MKVSAAAVVLGASTCAFVVVGASTSASVVRLVLLLLL